jgi:small subunit ribosomal protein S5
VVAQNRDRRGRSDQEQADEFEERVVNINRCSKVVKGGRNFHFSALVVVGDRSGTVGVGFGKANEVSEAIRKGSALARKSLVKIPMLGNTVTHMVKARFRGGQVVMRPASAGTGIIAGGAMRAVFELGGVQDILAKSLGSKNPVNVVKATMRGIDMLRTKQEMLEKRGISKLT